jgi:sigma-E factor negative regulatory protein RseB
MMALEVLLSGRCAPLIGFAVLSLASIGSVPTALADDATPWLARAATAARQLNYTGTIVYQHGGKVETSRLIHLNDRGEELEKLVSLDGPPREVIRNRGEVRCYYPDAKIVRIEPRTFRNAFPSLSPMQQKALLEFYDFRKAETARIAGLETQAWVFEPRDGLRYGHKFWVDQATGLLVKGRIIDENNEGIEQFTFMDIEIGDKVDRDMVKPTYPPAPPDWRVRQLGPGEVEMTDTGWVVTRVPPGFVKIVEGYRRLRGERQVAHLVYSDGLVAVSVFIEPVGGAPQPIGMTTQGGINVYARQLDESLVTVLGEAPAITIRQIANSVARR